jgi:hypothetical protein
MSTEASNQIEEFAVAHFEAAERLRMLMTMNTPTDYEARKKAAVELAQAQADEALARRELDDIIRGQG